MSFYRIACAPSLGISKRLREYNPHIYVTAVQPEPTDPYRPKNYRRDMSSNLEKRIRTLSSTSLFFLKKKGKRDRKRRYGGHSP